MVLHITVVGVNLTSKYIPTISLRTDYMNTTM